MKKILKKYVIAHKENDGKPELLRVGGALVTSLVIVSLFLLSFAFKEALLTQKDFNFAAVISSVLVDLANIDRQQNNITTYLRINPVLVAAAQMKADDMAAKSYFAHTSPEGVEPWYWFKQAGYKYSAAGENLAIHFSDSQDVNNAWMASPSHRQNILNGKFEEIGVAMAQWIYNGQTTTYVVQLFGKPLAVATPAPVASATTGEETEIPTGSQVKGETVPASEPEIKIVKEPTVVPVVTPVEEKLPVVELTETFVEVSAPEAEIAEEVVSAENTALPEVTKVSNTPSYASVLQEIAASPKRIIYSTYGIIAFFIIISLLSYLAIEIKRHHIRHLSFGAVLLSLIVVSVYAQQTFIYTNVFIK